MKNNFDFIDYIRQIQEQPFVDNTSQLLHVAFLSYQAGASNNDPKILNKSLYFINYIHDAYYQKNMSIVEIQQLYNNYINGNEKIDQEVPDATLEFYSGSQSFQTSVILGRKEKIFSENRNIQSQYEQLEIQNDNSKEQNKKKIIIQELKKENLNQQQAQQATNEFINQNDNIQIQNSIIQDDQQQGEISIPKIKDMYYLSIDQAQIVKKQQFEEYKKKESQKSMIFQVKNQQSQIMQSSECSICLEHVQSNRYALTACQHVFHKQCLENLIKTQDDLPVRCPNLDCRQEILRDDLESITTKLIMERLDKFAFNQYLLKNPNIFQCPTQNCKGLYEIEGPIQVCMICQQIFCTRCKKQYHEGICGEQSFINVAREQNYSQCSRCHRWIEKTFGCNHISCPCGHEFCYVCGKQWVRGQECRCIELPQNQQQQNQQQQQQQRQYNQRNRRQIQDGFNYIQMFFNNNNNRNNQRQLTQIQQHLQNFGLTFLQRIVRG